MLAVINTASYFVSSVMCYFINIKNSSNRNLSPITTPCNLYRTQHKQKSLLFDPIDENDEILHSQIVNNCSKLLKSKDFKPTSPCIDSTGNCNGSVSARKLDRALNGYISEFVMTPRGTYIKLST